MEVLIGVTLGLTLIGFAASAVACVFAWKSLAEVRGLQNSTHSIQYVPADNMPQKDIDTKMSEADAKFFDFSTLHKPTAEMELKETMI